MKSNENFISFLIVLLSLHMTICNDMFHRETSGVVFSPYVKKSQEGVNTWWLSYSLSDVKTMTEVISSRFSRISTYGVGAPNDDYEPNSTYYKSYHQVYAAEAAALVNRERNNRSLTILIGGFFSPLETQMEAELLLALECVDKSNSIYSNTVEGIVLSGFSLSEAHINTTIDNMQFLKEKSLSTKILVGTRQSCSDMTKNLARVRLLKMSDFIICLADASPVSKENGGKAAFDTVGKDLLQFRKKFKKLNPNVEVMGEINWASKGEYYHTIHNLKEYWLEADRWADINDFNIWMGEAFDNPWKQNDISIPAANEGWWWLRDNALVGKHEGYVEKIIEAPPTPKVPESTGLGTGSIVGIACGVFVFLLMSFIVVVLYFRVNKLQNALTKEDIREFMYGTPEDQLAQQGDSALGATETALQFPYDKSYELEKNQIKINEHNLLGSGQFGCVFKALIETDEPKEVALKTIKKDCPKTALKGLLSEIKILTYLGKHPNIVSIIGAYTSELKSGICYVATELCTLGSLESVLRNETKKSPNARYANAPVASSNYTNELKETAIIDVTFMDMTRWSHEIACGMEYLGVKHVVHADLATRNVLLSGDKTAKITDFGLSRRLYDYTNYVKQQQEPLPWRWMAVEALKRLEFSSMSDVWSYGVTLWEIFSKGDLPYPGLSWNLDFVDNLTNGLRMKSPPHASEEIYKIMVTCWHIDPKERPTFTALKISTGNILEGKTSSPKSETEDNSYANL